MLKRTFLITATLAATLALGGAVQAQDYGYPNQHQQNAFNHEDVATAIFGLLLLGVVAKAIDNNRDDSRKTVAPRRDDNLYVAPRHEPRRIAPDRGDCATITVILL